MSARLTPAQVRSLVDHGYVVLPGVVPPELVRAARARIQRDIGRQWRAVQALPAEPSPADIERVTRARKIAASAARDPALLALLNDSPVRELVEAAMGAPMLAVGGCQVATLFPAPPGDWVNESGYRDRDTPFYGWHGHLDGLWNGATAMHQRIDVPMTAEEFAAFDGDVGVNSVPKTNPGTAANVRNFTALVGVVLSDQRSEGVGNFAVLEGAHHAISAFFRKQRAAGGLLGPDGPDWPRLNRSAPNGAGLVHIPDEVRAAFMIGGQRGADGRNWPRPRPICAQPGDAIVALHGLPHDSTRVDGDEPRLNVYFRITRSGRPAGCEMAYADALCDPWIEWPGLQGLG